MNSPQVEATISAIEKKVVKELGLLPITTDPYFMKVWNHLLADEMLLAELTTQTLESAAVGAASVLQLAAERRAESAEARAERLEKALRPAWNLLDAIRVESMTGRYCGHKANLGHPLDWVLTRDAQPIASGLSAPDCGFLSSCANAVIEARAALSTDTGGDQK